MAGSDGRFRDRGRGTLNLEISTWMYIAGLLRPSAYTGWLQMGPCWTPRYLFTLELTTVARDLTVRCQRCAKHLHLVDKT